MSGGTLTDTRVEEGGEIDTRHFPGNADQRRRRTCGNDSDTIRNKEEGEKLFLPILSLALPLSTLCVALSSTKKSQVFGLRHFNNEIRSAVEFVL